jgi:Fe-S oxidoreductase/FAD/FMN-containing dehydrogenase
MRRGQMNKVDTIKRTVLKNIFGDRINFDKVERRLYSHDIAAIPNLLRPLIGNSVPEAVVQPINEGELIDLVIWARASDVALTPRGKASSGYGGVLPVRKGIVVDFYRMNRIISVDPQALTATVQAGVVWEKLDRHLETHRLTLTTYPTSYPGSTVGGWLAQGGAGIGSYEAGWFRDNVVSARVVIPDGTVKDFIGSDLDLVSDAEGITGFITEITIRVQPLEDMDVISIGCPDGHDLQHMIHAIAEANLPLWSLLFINPRMAELKNRAPVREHLGHPAEERILLPASYITTITFRSKDRDTVMSGLSTIIKACEAEILSDRIARHEWKHRFKLMVVKRLGPSLVPAEVVVPLRSLGDVLREIENKINQPIVKEGVVIRKAASGEPEVVILGFIPGDERKFGYNFVFSLSLTIMNIAEKYGGRAYATGLYFSKKAPHVLGADRVARLRKFKDKIDPKDILNPGKVIGNGLMGGAVRLGSVVEPMIRPLANHIITRIGELPGEPVRDIPADVAWYAYGCSQCGYCVDECDQFYGRGWESQSPRGKWYWLRRYLEGKEKWDQFMIDTILVCTTCELCNLRCSAALPIEPSWMKLRGLLINDKKKMTFPPFEMMAASNLKEGDIWAGYRKNRTDWFPPDLLETHGPSHRSTTAYFAGCTASYVEHDIAMASVRLLDEAGVDFTYVGEKENCCGTPMLVSGQWDIFETIMRRNLKAMEDAGIDTVISSCPACDMMWRNIYPQWAKSLGIDYTITARHYSEVLAQKIKAGEFSFPDTGQEKVTVTWHDSCHIGRVSGVYEPPRDIIKAIPHVDFVEMTHHHDAAHCCGSVLTLVKDPPIAADLGEIRLNEAIEAGARKVLALCPCCQVQLRVSADKKHMPVEVIDLARFAASTLGYDFPDPNPEVKAQWGVFEAMINLMTPRGFADLMGTMWPALINAMPFGRGPMMRIMGKVPGALDAMKPLFPLLFPRLLPMMMPKVMPVMLDRVAERIAMPDYMREQMPDLMPGVMDTLMPHMIGDVVPLVTQPMIDYLKEKR